MCVTGQTGSGKTRFVYRLLRHVKDMYADEPPEAILYCYGIHQPLFEEMEKTIPGIVFHEGLPSMETIREFTADRHHRLIVLDDLMHRVVRDVDMELLFTQGCHHRRLSVLFLTQNLFVQGTRSRTIALNTTYLVLMKNVRDVSQIVTLGRQLYPGRWKILMQSFEDATSNPYGYLIVDLAPNSDDIYRLRTQVFPGEDTTVYVPQKL
ncbi:Hypothetical predicted protein [Mytilus galloprovincialis]|nr:Hypothetical predicted protein [Mytilus galloprovincialis]